ITVNQPIEVLAAVVHAFRESGGDKPAYLQVHLSWADTEERAMEIAYDQWRTNVFGSALAWNLDTADQFDEAARFVQPEAVRESVLVSSDVEEHITWLSRYAELGFDHIYLHHVGQEQSKFIRVFGERVIPVLNS
ncbi:MAG TPA: LLM class F420-dependent oxidoreductase, partial [Acidimicrobiia bacterium]